MIRTVLSLAILLMIVSCHSSGTSNQQVTTAKSAASEDTTVAQEITPSLDDIYNGYLARYNDTVRVDTFFNVAAGRETISLRHYCLHDSALTIDDRYTVMYGLHHFVTHNFATSLKIKIEDRLVLDTIITRQMFADSLFKALQQYGGLMSPGISRNGDVVIVSHSFTIPLTDIGRLVDFVVSPEMFKKRE